MRRLNDAEEQLLEYALERAGDDMGAVSDEWDEEDDRALVSLVNALRSGRLRIEEEG